MLMWLARIFFGLVALILIVFCLSFLTPYMGEICDKNEYTGAKDCASYHVALVYLWQVGKVLNDVGVAITAVATACIAAFTFTLWKTSERQAILTRDALVADKRAFIFPSGLQHYWERDGVSYNWRFRPIWVNGGGTQSRRTRIYVDSELRNSRLPVGFDFTRTAYRPGNGLMYPKQTSFGGITPQYDRAAITPIDISDVQQGRKWLYVWGWVAYYDIFQDTIEHITRFCWSVIPIGDPFIYDPTAQRESIRFDTIHHDEGNSADEEAQPQP
jgi:hypothetical protein